MSVESFSEGASTTVQPMDESLEIIFDQMIQQGESSDAVDFIFSLEDDIFPSKKVIRTLIFNILMKHDDARCLSKISILLRNFIKSNPPFNEERRLFLYDAFREGRGYLSDAWPLFCHIVNSCFCHHDIYVVSEEDSEAVPLKYPNCRFLFDLYVKLYSVDFKHLYSDSFKLCLIMRLFWPDGNFESTKRTECLYKWINDIYDVPPNNQPPSLLENLHKILTLVVRSATEGAHPFRKTNEFFNNSSMMNVAEDVTNFCKNAFNSLPNIKAFSAFTTLPCFQARVSEKIIRLTFKLSTKSVGVLTLKDIVNQYMFPPKFNRKRNPKPSSNSEKNVRKRGERASDANRKAGKTILHELCEQNKFADLIEALKTNYEDMNTQDLAGNTPLHRACQMGSYMSIKILINEAGKAPIPKLDFLVRNSEGQTPLHIAVKANYLEIARLLLHSGGADSTNSVDNKGKLPIALSCSLDMTKLLDENRTPPIPSINEIDAFVEGSQVKEAPLLKTFKEYSIYLHALNDLLCSYTEVNNLYDFTFKKTDSIECHNSRKCCHYEFYETACLEDTVLLSEMPDLIDVFIQSIKKNVAKLNINVDIELIPLRGYKASIQTKK